MYYIIYFCLFYYIKLPLDNIKFIHPTESQANNLKIKNVQ